MTRMPKAALSALLSLTLALGTVPAPALAQMSEEVMGEEPTTQESQTSKPVAGPSVVEEESSTVIPMKDELVNESDEPLSQDSSAQQLSSELELTTEESNISDQATGVDNSETITSMSEEPELLLEAQASGPIIPSSTANSWLNDYTRWGSVSQESASYLHATNGSLERVEYQKSVGGGSSGLVVERMDSSLRYATSHLVVSRSTYVPSNLASDVNFVWGGFYAGASHNYVLTGQTNTSQNNGLTVFRLTKYTKGWAYVGNLEIKGANTTYPFDAGTCDMIEQNGNLYIRTCHTMYKSSDGYNHQANVQLVVDENAMKVKSQQTGVWNSSGGYVSHSFAQYLARSNDAVYGLDHGDAFPRAIFVKNLTSSAQRDINLISFGGEVGNNTTGASVGGMEHSSSTNRLLVAGSLADQSVLFGGAGKSDNSVMRNVFVATTPTPNLGSSNVRYLTSLNANGTVTTSTPQIVKIDNNRFVVIWGQRDVQAASNEGGYGNKVYYQFVDGSGNALSGTREAQGKLSNCKPVLWGKRVVWYTGGKIDAWGGSSQGAPTFYAIDAYSGSFSSYAPFPDVPVDSWFAGVVVRAASLGLINGYGNGNFGPNDKVKRGQVAAILWNMAGKPAAGKGVKSFPDVASGKFYYDAVRWASSVGVVSGYANGKFGPEDNVTREQLAVMLANYSSKVAQKQASGSASDFSSMSDASKVSKWAAPSVGWCFKNGILSGKGGGRVDPQGNATRAESSKMVVYLHDMLA